MVNETPYTLVIDRDRSDVLAHLFQLVDSPMGMALLMHLRSKDLHTVFLDLLKEQSDKVHERDWCDDPDCEDKK